MIEKEKNRNLFFLILVASLGYFVDIYDLLLFLIIENKSLAALGVPADKITETGLLPNNLVQIYGLP
jgi:putative MFS transporter